VDTGHGWRAHSGDGLNRLADRKFDALNRAENWELPQGKVKVGEAILLTVLASAVFILAAYELNWLCFVLSPVALAIVFFYSLTKRFTWASHLFLGLALAIAPIGAWLAVARPPFEIAELQVPLYLGLAVVFWLAGFDIIYRCKTGSLTADWTHSLVNPGPLNCQCSLRRFCSRSGRQSGRVGDLLARIHGGRGSLLGAWDRQTDGCRVNKAFFGLNAYVSLGYFLFTLAIFC
jgi:4-hydroxybenzoate polyprenyltransferase